MPNVKNKTPRAQRASLNTRRNGLGKTLAVVALATAFAAPQIAHASQFLPTLHHHPVLASTVPANGDQNPYAMVIAPVSAGSVQKGDVLIDNFNNAGNLQGLGSTIVDYRPGATDVTLFAAIPRDLAGCPGGVGLSTAMTMLKSGWVVVGSTPSKDGNTATIGQGCLIVLNPQGEVAAVWSDANIRDPWGNMAVIDKGDSATLFVSNSGFGVGAATDNSPIEKQATVLRIELSIPEGKVPQITNETVVASGLSEQADKSVFLIGPTGLALGRGGKLYISDSVSNSIVTIDDAVTRTSSGGPGKVLTHDGLLSRPLALALAPGGNLIAVNGLNGQVVEIDPYTGKQLGALWINTDKAQTPAGSGDLFGIAIAPSGKSFYFVDDDTNSVAEAQ